MGCMSSCEEVYHQCKNIFMLTGLNALPDCKKTSPITQQPLSSSSNCNAIATKLSNPNAYYNLSYIPDNFVIAQCPAPFVKDVGYGQPEDTTGNAFCKAGCCLPCPQQNFVKYIRFYNLTCNIDLLFISSILPTGLYMRFWRPTLSDAYPPYCHLL